MRTDRLNRWLAPGTALALFVWFVHMVHGGLDSWFDADDLMNLHNCWSRPWSEMLKANLFFWSSYTRPGGCVFYRSIYSLWGFDPLPFRIAALALLCVDFGLLAVVVRQLTGSRWCALLALVLLGANPGFSSAYFDTGAIYDVLAYTLFWIAFAVYVRIRHTGRTPGWGTLALLLGLFIVALNCKELSVSLPVAVLLYELVWYPPTDWRVASLWRWICHEGRFAAIGALLDIVYVIGKRYGPNSLWESEAFRPHYSAAAYFQSAAHYLQELTFGLATITPWQIGGLLAMMAVVTAIARRRCLVWGLGFILTGILPLAFIPARGGFAYFLPSVGWAVYISGVFDWLFERLAAQRMWMRAAAQASLLALLFVVLVPPQRRWIGMHEDAAHNMQSRFARYEDQIAALIPAPRKGARILLLSDAEGYDDYDVHFLIRLFYGDPTIDVERATVWKQRHVQMDPIEFDYVLDWVDGRFVLVSHR